MALPVRTPTGSEVRIRHLFATGALRLGRTLIDASPPSGSSLGASEIGPGVRRMAGSMTDDLFSPSSLTSSSSGGERCREVARDLWPDGDPDPTWCLAAVRGRMVELTGSHRAAGRVARWGGAAAARLTFAATLVAEAQGQRESAAWICLAAGRGAASGPEPSSAPDQALARPAASFFPPDLGEFGVDLRALAVAAVPAVGDVLRVADQLLRSGAFGVVVLDLERAGSASTGAGPRPAGGTRIPLAAQVRLANLCQRHDAALLCLTEQKDFVLAGMRGVSRCSRERDGFRCSLAVEKDKKHGREWQWSERFRGPAGLY